MGHHEVSEEAVLTSSQMIFTRYVFLSDRRVLTLTKGPVSMATRRSAQERTVNCAGKTLRCF